MAPDMRTVRRTIERAETSQGFGPLREEGGAASWRVRLTGAPELIAATIARVSHRKGGLSLPGIDAGEDLPHDVARDAGAGIVADIACSQERLLGMIGADESIEAWRAMTLHVGHVGQLEAGDPTGSCWTHRQQLSIPCDGAGSGTMYRSHARLPATSLDWPETIGLHDSGEAGIRARHGAGLTLLGIDDMGARGTVFEANLRPDLAGATMRAGHQN